MELSNSPAWRLPGLNRRIIMATIEQTQQYYANQADKQLRSLLRRDYGDRKYRITHQSIPEVHVYGQMPNSIETGWWFLGYLPDVRREYCI